MTTEWMEEDGKPFRYSWVCVQCCGVVLWWPHSRFTKCLTPHYLIDCDIEVKDWRKVNLIDFVEGFLALSEMTYTRDWRSITSIFLATCKFLFGHQTKSQYRRRNAFGGWLRTFGSFSRRHDKNSIYDDVSSSLPICSSSDSEERERAHILRHNLQV